MLGFRLLQRWDEGFLAEAIGEIMSVGMRQMQFPSPFCDILKTVCSFAPRIANYTPLANPTCMPPCVSAVREVGKRGLTVSGVKFNDATWCSLAR